MGIRLERKSRARPAVLTFDKAFWDDVAKVYEGAILSNILRQQQANGERLKINAPSTRARKQRLGRPLLSLVDNLHRFVKGMRQSWTLLRYLPGGGIVIGPANDELRRLSREVQAKGYTGWMGLGRDGRAAMKALLRKKLVDLVRRGRR